MQLSSWWPWLAAALLTVVGSCLFWFLWDLNATSRSMALWQISFRICNFLMMGRRLLGALCFCSMVLGQIFCDKSVPTLFPFSKIRYCIALVLVRTNTYIIRGFRKRGKTMNENANYSLDRRCPTCTTYRKLHTPWAFLSREWCSIQRTLSPCSRGAEMARCCEICMLNPDFDSQSISRLENKTFCSPFVPEFCWVRFHPTRLVGCVELQKEPLVPFLQYSNKRKMMSKSSMQ